MQSVPDGECAGVVVGEDDDRAGVEVIGDLIEVVEQGGCLGVSGAVVLAEQDRAGQGGVLPGEQLIGVGVCRDQDPRAWALARDMGVVRDL